MAPEIQTRVMSFFVAKKLLNQVFTSDVVGVVVVVFDIAVLVCHCRRGGGSVLSLALLLPVDVLLALSKCCALSIGLH